MRNLTFTMLCILPQFLLAQQGFNSAQTQMANLASQSSGLSIGGYAEITYNNLDGSQTPADTPTTLGRSKRRARNFLSCANPVSLEFPRTML